MVYPFRPEGTLLQVGADYGALTGLLSRKTAEVTVLDQSQDQLEFCRKRYAEAGNIREICGDLTGFQKEQAGEQFDYIVMAGSLKPDYEAQIAAAKALLKPEGTDRDSVQFPWYEILGRSSKRRTQLFKKSHYETSDRKRNREEELEWYYPMPDYKVPMSIYSQGYLPVKGDLTNTMTAYDYPKYLQLDVGASFDTVCEDGQFENFANSFLMIWRSHGSN